MDFYDAIKDEFSSGENRYMKRVLISVFTVMVILLSARSGYGQADNEKKFELGAQFSILGISDPNSFDPDRPHSSQQHRTEAGFGARFTYNINRYFGLEAEGNFFPRDFRRVTTNFTGGRIVQGLFGLKSGIRKERIGFFGKVRPGFVSSGRAAIARFPNGDGSNPRDPFGFELLRATQLAMDVGGVVEFYPSHRTIVRFDIGDTIIRYPDVQFICFPAGVPCPEDVYRNKVQFSAGIGFRF
ncbi:MAG: hypothetical protein ABR577_07925 [Pyrinomonadaceae bacterium]